MSDKDRAGEIHGATDALRPMRPGGEPKTTGETDQQPDPANAIPRAGGAGGVEGTEGSRGRDERASGMIDDPIDAGEFQAGDRAELAQQRGGPVDILPDGPKRR